MSTGPPCRKSLSVRIIKESLLYSNLFRVPKSSRKDSYNSVADTPSVYTISYLDHKAPLKGTASKKAFCSCNRASIEDKLSEYHYSYSKSIC
ncbi:hypothetical protein AVEN_173233-1 [Araneus ventricosus]|uniref:Uncharacterized protein n=1 Tax=Araneus ventricosus TaxID=182803 RepID=A0A4Y2H2C9_ARAVE|nr:hypothetical protein AVEN_173233-1 [Araneus ventricosus]